MTLRPNDPLVAKLQRLKGASTVGLNKGLLRAATMLAEEAAVAADSLEQGLEVDPIVTGNVITPEQIEYVVSTDERDVPDAVAASLEPIGVLGYAASGIQGRMRQVVTEEVARALKESR